MSDIGIGKKLVSAFSAGSFASLGPSGLTKREWIATMCLQGILANKTVGKASALSTVQSAVMYADQLLDCLAKEMPADESVLQANTLPMAVQRVAAHAS